MQILIASNNRYTIPEVENCIKDLDHELTDFATIQAEADAKKDQEISHRYYKVQLIDFVQVKVQKAINHVRQLILAAAEIFNTKELELVSVH